MAIFRLGRLVSVENKKEDMKTLCTLIERGGFSDFFVCLEVSLTFDASFHRCSPSLCGFDT